MWHYKHQEIKQWILQQLFYLCKTPALTNLTQISLWLCVGDKCFGCPPLTLFSITLRAENLPSLFPRLSPYANSKHYSLFTSQWRAVVYDCHEVKNCKTNSSLRHNGLSPLENNREPSALRQLYHSPTSQTQQTWRRRGSSIGREDEEVLQVEFSEMTLGFCCVLDRKCKA